MLSCYPLCLPQIPVFRTTVTHPHSLSSTPLPPPQPPRDEWTCANLTRRPPTEEDIRSSHVTRFYRTPPTTAPFLFHIQEFIDCYTHPHDHLCCCWLCVCIRGRPPSTDTIQHDTRIHFHFEPRRTIDLLFFCYQLIASQQSLRRLTLFRFQYTIQFSWLHRVYLAGCC